MNYHKIYLSLIENAKNNKESRLQNYSEKHHILPKCMGGSEDESNLVALTAREHFIAHALLAKIHNGTPNGYKLASSFNMMCRDGQGGNRYFNSRLFEIARKLYSDNHPCKTDVVKDKISKTLLSLYETSEWKEKSEARKLDFREDRICLCGCGEKFTCMISAKKKYIVGHKHLDVSLNKKTGEAVSVSLTEYLSNLSKDELKTRMKNSFGSCDHIKRGSAISASKKGKKTNQQQIMGERYASMTDEEFFCHIAKFSAIIKTRSVNLRNKWKLNKQQ